MSLQGLSARLPFGGRVMALVLLAALAIAAFVFHAPAERLARKLLAEIRLERDVGRIQALIGDSEVLPFEQRVDRVRRFVNDNSEHKIDEEMWSYTHDEPRVVGMLLDHARGAGKQPHMECSSRSRVMGEILRKLGIRSRLVHVYQPIRNYPSHTYLEVFNPASQSWEIQDPDYDLFYWNAATAQRLSTEAMLSRPLEELQPCQAPERCGWDLVSRERKEAKALSDYFKAAVIRDGWDVSLLVNPARFDLKQSRPVADQMLTFCEHDPSLCAGPVTEVGAN